MRAANHVSCSVPGTRDPRTTQRGSWVGGGGVRGVLFHGRRHGPRGGWKRGTRRRRWLWDRQSRPCPGFPKVGQRDPESLVRAPTVRGCLGSQVSAPAPSLPNPGSRSRLWSEPPAVRVTCVGATCGRSHLWSEPPAEGWECAVTKAAGMGERSGPRRECVCGGRTDSTRFGGRKRGNPWMNVGHQREPLCELLVFGGFFPGSSEGPAEGF